MKDDSEPLFKTIEKYDDREVILNTLTGETYTIYEKDIEEVLGESGLGMQRLEEILTLINKYYGKKKR